MSQPPWQPDQYDPYAHQQRVQPGYHERYPRQSYPGQPYPQQAWGMPEPPRHRRRSRAPLYAGIAAVVVLAAGGTAYALAGHGGTAHGSTAHRVAAAKPLTCRQQYAIWKTGPARAAVLKLQSGGAAVSAAGASQDIPAMRTALRALGADAGQLGRYPVPACADPAGYFPRYLAAMKAAGDNAGAASGLGGVLLAEAPLKRVPALQASLGAEIKRTTGY